jgi:diphosphomevalonate decarboxylase
MPQYSASAIAHPNIALIKYWGNTNHELRLPSNGSISMTLGNLFTQTTVTFDSSFPSDELIMNDAPVSGDGLSRVCKHLDIIRNIVQMDYPARVITSSNFPVGAGIASSASGFAALSLAATAAAGLELSLQELSRLSRRGSGSACRSVFGGYVEWIAGDTDLDSYAQPLFEEDHWKLVDLVAVISTEHKETGSTTGHALADTSPLQFARVQDADRRLLMCRESLQGRDFHTLATIAEEDSNIMHAVMMTSNPPLLYWRPATIKIMRSVLTWRRNGLEVFYTIDAGPNVHCICSEQDADEVYKELNKFDDVLEIIRGTTGGNARLITI